MDQKCSGNVVVLVQVCSDQFYFWSKPVEVIYFALVQICSSKFLYCTKHLRNFYFGSDMFWEVFILVQTVQVFFKFEAAR